MCVWVRVFWEEALKTVGCEPTVAEYTRLTGILLVGLGPQLPQCGVWCVCVVCGGCRLSSVVCRLSFVVCCLLFVVLLFVVCCLLCVVCCVLLVV